jgi:cyclase
MSITKVIPCLDTRDGKLVKGIHFVDLKELGDPAEAGKAYSEAGADELVLLDITASHEGRKTFMEAVERTVNVIDCPLTIGGGISSTDDIQRLFDVGVSKASMNTAAILNPDLVAEAAGKFGSDRVTVAIDTRQNQEMDFGFEAVIKGGREGAGIDAVEWAKKVEQLGAGSILPTSMDTDGVQTGYDIPMTRAIADAVEVPIIASGGAGALEHLSEVVIEGHADHVLVASIAHYGTFTIKEMKEHLASKGLEVSL